MKFIPVCLLSLSLLVITGMALPAVNAQERPAVSHSVPAFTLKDTKGKERALKAFRGQPVVLYFFCPCADCHRVAELWGQGQRGMTQAVPGKNEKPQNTKDGTVGQEKPPVTLVVFAGEPEEARSFRDEVGLDAAQTTLLSDSDSKVAQTYDAIPCPRVFVLDANGVLRYTNREPNAKVSVIEPAIVVSKITDTLQAIAKKAASRKSDKPNGSGSPKKP